MECKFAATFPILYFTLFFILHCKLYGMQAKNQFYFYNYMEIGVRYQLRKLSSLLFLVIYYISTRMFIFECL